MTSSLVGRYRKLSLEIEAVRWDGSPEGATPIINWILENNGTARYYAPGEWDMNETSGTYIVIDTLEGRMLAGVEDWIIRGIKSEFYPCKPDIFGKTYEAVEANHDPVNHPKHYKHPSGVEAIEITRYFVADLANAIKYVFRAPHKNGLEDYEKALWYLNDFHKHYCGGDFCVQAMGPGVDEVDTKLRRVAEAEEEGVDTHESWVRAQFFREVADRRFHSARVMVEELVALNTPVPTQKTPVEVS